MSGPVRPALHASLRRAALIACLGAVAACASTALAWGPGRFDAWCGLPGGTTAAQYAAGPSGDVAGGDCLSAERRALVERFAAGILARYAQEAFASPYPSRLGPVVERDGEQRVRIYLSPTNRDGSELGTAHALSPCLQGGGMARDTLTIVTLSSTLAAEASEPLLYYVLAHELFHMVMNAQALADDERYCQARPWLTEGAIDAAATFVTRERFPRFTPPLSDPVARNLYGLRRYDHNWLTHTPGVAPYRTSAFWHSLAAITERTPLEVLAAYTGERLGDDGDALRWLEARLEADPAVGASLWATLPEVYADIASWGRRAHAAAVGDRLWLSEAFGGCSTVSLSPRQPARSLTLELDILSAQCLRVLVGGLEPDQVASVKLMATDAVPDPLDELHLALERAPGRLHIDGSDVRDFDCFDELRRHWSVEGCVRMPFSGERSDQPGFARTWAAFAQRADGAGALEQRYVLSRVPLTYLERRDGDAAALRVHLRIALEVTTVATPSTPAQGDTTIGTAGLRGSRSILDPTMALVPIAGDDLSDIDALDPTRMLDLVMLEAMPMIEHLPGYLDGLFLVLGTVAAEDDGDAMPSAMLDLRYLLTLAFDPDLPGGAPTFGDTRTFEAWVGGVASTGGMGPLGMALPGMGMDGLCNYPDPPDQRPSEAVPAARVEVLAFDDTLLHLRFEGVFGTGRPSHDGRFVCADPQPFAGELIAPFGWLYTDAGMRSLTTPGIEADRALRYARMRQAIGLPIAPGPTGPGDGPGGGGGAGAVAEEVCDCSCETLVGFGETLDGLGDFDPLQLDPEAAEVFACIDLCGMPRLMQCLMQTVD